MPMQTVDLQPVADGVATLKALCEQLDLVSRGLCREV